MDVTLSNCRQPITIFDGFDNNHAYVGNFGTRFLFLTDLDAPNGRIVSVDVRAPDARTVVLAEGEAPIEGVTGETIFQSVRQASHASSQAHYIAKPDDARAFLIDHLRPGDLVLTMGAGDIWRQGKPLLETLQARAAAL